MKLKFIQSSLFYKILFVLSLSVLLFISSITYKHINNLSNSTNSVVHSYKISLELEQLISYLKDAETGIRGYVITKDVEFLDPYNGSREKVNNSFIALKKYTKGDVSQQANLNMLYVLINKRYQFFNYTLEHNLNIELSEDKTFKKNFILGKVVMDSIRIQIDKMIAKENETLDRKNKEYDYQINITPVFTITIILLTLILILLSFFKINNDVKRLKLINDDLIFSKARIDQAEIIGQYSSWIWNLDTDKMVFSDNQYRLFGCEPQSFEASNNVILNFIHPDDKVSIENVIQDIIDEKDFNSVDFRIIRQDTGETRYIKSIGKLIIDSYGKKNIIGSNFDITQEYFANLKLEDRNLDLERSNKELASFNHVASHDLQEPLRKIQTFISRFSDEDKNLISENGKNYISKIEDSANRMRILIDDLLLFSRTNKSEKVFEKADLNFILENSKQELSQVITDKNAIITSDKLPFTNVIEFQMQQLFTNLIGNSLKYSNKNVPLKIEIICEIIIAENYPILNLSTKDKFYKISFTDNGMGFEQEQAEKIFVLFNRLHPANDFPGTGIGLTICKKIAENHKGFLFAEGYVNKGAIFNLFLPINL